LKEATNLSAAPHIAHPSIMTMTLANQYSLEAWTFAFSTYRNVVRGFSPLLEALASSDFEAFFPPHNTHISIPTSSIQNIFKAIIHWPDLREMTVFFSREVERWNRRSDRRVPGGIDDAHNHLDRFVANADIYRGNEAEESPALTALSG
jgi:hypothetical protein